MTGEQTTLPGTGAFTEVGYCPISGRYFPGCSPGDKCPIHPANHDLTTLPDGDEGDGGGA